MHKFTTKPSSSYQSLVSHGDGKVIDEQQFQFNTYTAENGPNSPHIYETQQEDVVGLSQYGLLDLWGADAESQ